jgi:hypothetical protein
MPFESIALHDQPPLWSFPLEYDKLQLYLLLSKANHMHFLKLPK